ncbi:MAG: inositol monophosphatase family protein [Gemmatimonadaceae bacterium]
MNAPDASQENPAVVRERVRLLGVARIAAHAAAGVVRSRAPEIRTLDWQSKSRTDFVTEVDIAAEESLRASILRDVPGAAIVGEELTPDGATNGDIAFVVDPLDGTTNFLHGYPWYAVSVGVLVGGVPAAGVVINIASGDEFAAAVGAGATMNGETMHVSRITEPARALIGTGFPFKTPHQIDRYAEQFKAITRDVAGIRRAGAAALDLTDVACGRFEAFWELQLSPWDYAAGAVIIREAGGIVTNLRGDAPDNGASSIVAGNPIMHAWLLAAVRDPSSPSIERQSA